MAKGGGNLKSYCFSKERKISFYVLKMLDIFYFIRITFVENVKDTREKCVDDARKKSFISCFLFDLIL